MKVEINLLGDRAVKNTRLPFAIFQFEQSYIHPGCSKPHKVSRRVLVTNIRYLFENDGNPFRVHKLRSK